MKNKIAQNMLKYNHNYIWIMLFKDVYMRKGERFRFKPLKKKIFEIERNLNFTIHYFIFIL